MTRLLVVEKQRELENEQTNKQTNTGGSSTWLQCGSLAGEEEAKSHLKGKPGSPDEERLWYTQDKITELENLGSWSPPLA